MTRKITVQQGLNELKLLDSRINKLIQKLKVFFAENKNGELFNKNDTKKLENGKSELASLLQLIKNRSELKQKIVQSNAVTKVVVANVEYTVAEAIEKKDSISYEQNLVAKLQRDLGDVESNIQRYNAKLDEELNRQIQVHLGNATDKKDDSTKEIIEMLTKRQEKEKLSVKDFSVNYKGQNVSIAKLHDLIDDDVQAFLSEVDYVLTHSNVLTQIELND